MELGSDGVVHPGAADDDKHRKAVHFLAKRRNVFSAVTELERRRDVEREDCVSLYTLIRE